jgi:hypothetical protein
MGDWRTPSGHGLAMALAQHWAKIDAWILK